MRHPTLTQVHVTCCTVSRAAPYHVLHRITCALYRAQHSITHVSRARSQLNCSLMRVDDQERMETRFEAELPQRFIVVFLEISKDNQGHFLDIWKGIIGG